MTLQPADFSSSQERLTSHSFRAYLPRASPASSHCIMEPDGQEERPAHEVIALEESFAVDIRHFFSIFANDQFEFDALRAFLRDERRYQKPTSYISDLETRLELLRDIRLDCNRRQMEQKFFTAALWAAFMVAPLDKLRQFRDQLRQSSTAILVNSCIKALHRELPVAMKLCKLGSYQPVLQLN
jgi:hypothetical protein